MKRLVFVRELAGSFSGSVVKNPPANARDSGDKGSIPVWGISPREGNGSPLQYSCLENSMDRGAWWATVHGVALESDMTEHTHTICSTLYENVYSLFFSRFLNLKVTIRTKQDT